MKHRFSLFIALAVLALTSLACGLTINIPVDRVTTGPTQTEEISIPATAAQVTNLHLSFGAGDLQLEPGAEDMLVTGTAEYNVPEFEPKVEQDGAEVHLETGNLDINGIPRFDDEVKNAWQLKLGDQPMNLEINAGAYKGDFDLSGLSLKSLHINDGAADVRLRFSEPNPVEMEIFRYSTGASNVRLNGLGNANFTSMIFRSGAGNYSLDFSGDLQRSAVVTIESGFSQVTLIVPRNTSARVLFEGGFSGVDASGGWEKSGEAYVLGSGEPLLTINVDLGAGNLVLRTE